MITRIPFTVSARTARLIGRENVATAKGAIIELVKNGYDADSRYSIVYINNNFSELRESIEQTYFDDLLLRGCDETLLNRIYSKADNKYMLNNTASNIDIQEFRMFQKKQCELFIVDCGEGMTRQIIESCWMTIGTDNKAFNYITAHKRIKAGAKGIGRFALDKLGDTCEMVTIYDPNVHTDVDAEGNSSGFNGNRWIVNWGDFDGDNKTINDVNASLEGLNISYMDCIEASGLPTSITSLLKDLNATHGTILKISNLRDTWEEENVTQLYDDLGVLVPPTENDDYAIVLRESLNPEKYGLVESAFCDDYDYKIEAHADDNQRVSITVYRREYDVERISPSFFARDNQKKTNFTKEVFLRGYWTTERTFSELIPGFKAVDINNVFNQIGPFDMTFYFLKRGATKQDIERFCYKQCAYGLRSDWLNKFGGIKLFRDGFRVRPYGERNDSAFDWLGLGARKQKSPAGVAKAGGGYKVEVENVAGSIRISRLTNLNFDDKSSREGLQENQAFRVFKQLIQGIIAIFEDDRACIARELEEDDNMRNGAARNNKAAKILVEKILSDQKYSQTANLNAEQAYQFTLLASLTQQQSQEIEKLHEEQHVLRALASSGLMLASFSHDLSKLNDSMNNRYEKIKSLFLTKLAANAFEGVEERKNPFLLLDKAMKTDQKMQNWLNFSTGIIKKDKRKRKNINLQAYFKSLRATRKPVFDPRAIALNITGVEDLTVRAFEIDFDSIFYNLFSNSVEAFTRMREDRPRCINVKFSETKDGIICDYKDNGPGLSPDILNPDDIMQPLFTTKRNRITGEEIGTGLGMWIVKLIADDNDASLHITSPVEGFGLRLSFPRKYKI